MSRLQEIISNFPVRKSDMQKEAFLRQAAGWMGQMGYAARVEENGSRGSHRNLVAGSPEEARVIFTAHYDTPASMPLPNLLLPRNLPLFMGYQLVVVGALVAVSLLAGLAVFALVRQQAAMRITFFIIYYALLMLLIMGPANKNNANDNTSGVAAVLRVMELLPPEQRGLCAFILFDNEEKGKLGSKAFARQHPSVRKGTLVINLDCVGVGEHVLFISQPAARALGDEARLRSCFSAEEGFVPHFYSSMGSAMNSDHKSFRRSVGVAACRRKRLVGYYTSRIHTRRDTLAREENIEYIGRGLAAFVKSLAEV